MQSLRPCRRKVCSLERFWYVLFCCNSSVDIFAARGSAGRSRVLGWAVGGGGVWAFGSKREILLAPSWRHAGNTATAGASFGLLQPGGDLGPSSPSLVPMRRSGVDVCSTALQLQLCKLQQFSNVTARRVSDSAKGSRQIHEQRDYGRVFLSQCSLIYSALSRVGKGGLSVVACANVIFCAR